MSTFDFDLIVIGGGSGGVRAARTAADAGARVALCEESRLGGTCVIRGCVPKKLMVYASGFPEQFDMAAAYGWSSQNASFDWPRFREKLHGELDRLEGVYGSMLDKSGVTTFAQRARLTDPHEIELADGARHSAAHILIATGGHPIRPPIPNAELAMVSNDMFLLEELPKSMLIVGGGYIGCEFANIMAGFGVEVSMFLRAANILNGFDDECRGLISERMRARGIDIHTGATITDMHLAGEAPVMAQAGSDAAMGAPVSADTSPNPDFARNDKSGTAAAAGCPVWAETSTGTKGSFDRVLMATGRAPSTAEMGLGEIGVELSENGAVKVDEYSQSSVPSVFAIGDATDRVALTPVAIREAMAFSRTVFRGERTPVDHDTIPSAVFTRPELGTVGMTEDEAMERGGIEVYCTAFKPMQSSFAGQDERTMMKLIVSKEDRTVLGCHIVAEQAAEMIQLAGIAVKAGLTKEQFDATCAVHPTIAEELVTMSTPTRSG